MSGIESGGYSVAKFGNVILTRMFPYFDPKPSDDGVKTYALCPFFVPTRLVLEEYGKEVSVEDAKRRAAKDIINFSKSRMLAKEEVGEAMIQSLKKDVDGSVYFIYPGLPLIEVPDSGVPLIAVLYAVGKVAIGFGKDSLNVRDVKILLFVLLYIAFYMLHKFILLFLSIMW